MRILPHVSAKAGNDTSCVNPDKLSAPFIGLCTLLHLPLQDNNAKLMMKHPLLPSYFLQYIQVAGKN